MTKTVTIDGKDYWGAKYAFELVGAPSGYEGSEKPGLIFELAMKGTPVEVENVDYLPADALEVLYGGSITRLLLNRMPEEIEDHVGRRVSTDNITLKR